MHWHRVPDEPGYTPAYCAEHAPPDEPMYECWAEFAWHACCVCEEAASCVTCMARLEERTLVGCETFSLVMHDPESSVTWDVDRAWQIVRLNPRPAQVLPDDVAFQGGDVDFEHLEHIPLEQRGVPGLAVVLHNVLPDGTDQTLVVQIDGSHRAALAVGEGRPHEVYVLTEQEHVACVMLYLVDGVPMPLPRIAGPARTL